MWKAPYVLTGYDRIGFALFAKYEVGFMEKTGKADASAKLGLRFGTTGAVDFGAPG